MFYCKKDSGLCVSWLRLGLGLGLGLIRCYDNGKFRDRVGNRVRAMFWLRMKLQLG